MKFTLTIDGDTTDPRAVSVLALLAGINTTTLTGNTTISAPPGVLTADPDDEPAVAVAGDPNERDANGLPWSEEIHSKARSKNADGTWRKRKGVQSDLVTAVEARLRAANGTPAPVPASTPAAPPVTPPAAQPVAAPVPVTAEAPPAAPPAAPAVTGAPADFGAFMEIFSKSMGAKLIDSEGQFLAWLCAQPDVAVGQITEIAASPAKITAAYNHLVAQNRIAP